jgi:hypothetical protein
MEMTMPRDITTIPNFRTEAEEANWWDRHPEVAMEIMSRAIKSGKAKRSAPLKTVTMRLPVPDIPSRSRPRARKGASLSDVHQNAAARGPQER